MASERDFKVVEQDIRVDYIEYRQTVTLVLGPSNQGGVDMNTYAMFKILYSSKRNTSGRAGG